MKRMGKFYLQQRTLDQWSDDFIRKIFAAMGYIPYRAEYLPHRKAFEHIGDSPLFDAYQKGEEVPEYQLTVSNIEGQVSVKAKRV